MSDFFKSLVKELKDPNTSLLEDGESSAEYSGCIDTGSFILNAVLSGSLYGGVPNNKITAFAGESATGKTFFVLGVVKQFLEDNPTGGVIYYDTEAAVTKDMMSKRGVDTKRVVIAEPDTIEKFRTHAIKVLESYEKQSKESRPPMMMVLDSLGLLSTNKEVGDVAEGKDVRDMTKSQVIKGAFRVLTLKLAQVGVPLLVTNHVYELVGSYVPTKEMGGGSGLKYAASTIAYLSKKKEKDGDGDVIGNIIKVKMHKSRFTKEHSQVEVLLTYDKGLDRYYGLLDLAEKYNIFKKVSTRYELPDGKTAFGKQINSDPEKYYTPEVMEQLEVAAGKEFKYGMSND
ncbi:recombinase RecA [bacterium]|nr:recombinase RecA [bacterium]